MRPMKKLLGLAGAVVLVVGCGAQGAEAHLREHGKDKLGHCQDKP